jgi:hypothetical protein
VFGELQPIGVRSVSSHLKPFFFAYTAANDSFADPLTQHRIEVFDGIEFTVKTRTNHYGQFVYGVCTTQRKISEACVVIKSASTDETGEDLLVAENMIEFVEFSPGKWCGETEFDLKMLEERLNDGAFTVAVVLKSACE